MSRTGLPSAPVQARIRTLHRGYLPAIEYAAEENGLCYPFRLFAADVGGALKGVPVRFATVTVSKRLESLDCVDWAMSGQGPDWHRRLE